MLFYLVQIANCTNKNIWIRYFSKI